MEGHMRNEMLQHMKISCITLWENQSGREAYICIVMRGESKERKSKERHPPNHYLYHTIWNTQDKHKHNTHGRVKSVHIGNDTKRIHNMS